MGWRNQGWLCTAPQPGALWQALCSSGDEGWEWAAAGRGQIPATIHLLPANLEKDKTTPIFSAALCYSVGRTYFSQVGFAIQSPALLLAASVPLLTHL